MPDIDRFRTAREDIPTMRVTAKRRLLIATLLMGSMALAFAVTSAALARDASGAGPPKDIRKFVRQHYIHGVPYKEARRYTQKDAKVLLKMLAKPAENEAFLSQIVTTLCFIGDEKAVKPLIRFVESPLESEAAFNAKNAALIHMGEQT